MPVQKKNKIPSIPNLGGFLSASYVTMKMEALSIMSSPVSPRTVVLATKGSWQRYRCLHKQQQIWKKEAAI